MQRTILFLYFCFISFVIEAQTGWFIPSSKFSSGLINDVCQDGEGFIWVATDYGLNRFDGYRFTTFLHQRNDTTTLSSNIVGVLFCDKKGNMWIGTTKGLDRYDHTTVVLLHYSIHPLCHWPYIYNNVYSYDMATQRASSP